MLNVFTVKKIEANGHPFEIYEAGSGDRLALCLHGFPEHAVSWHSQVPTLLDLGYKVWAPNQRGYGNSYRPDDVAEYKIEKLVDDIAGFIDASGAKSVTLLAHDWGAMISWFFAMRKKRPLEKLVILSIPHPGTMAEHFFGAQMFKSWYIYYFLIPGLAETGMSRQGGKRLKKLFERTAKHPENIDPEEMKLYMENVSTKERARCLLNWYRANMPFGMMEEMKNMPVIETPTLLLWGEDDVALCKETSYGTDKYVKNLCLRYLKGVSHWMQQDASDIANTMIEAFLSGKDVPQYSP